MLPLIAVTVCIAIALAVYGVWRRSQAQGTVVRRRLTRPGDLRLAPASLLRNQRRGGIAGDWLPLSAARRERIAHQLELAGRPLRPSEYVAIRVVVGALGAGAGVIFALALDWNTYGVAVCTAGLGLLGWILPQALLKRAQARRAVRIEAQLPEALTAIAKSLRAGTGLLQALAYAADETPAPLGEELRATLRDLELGAEPDAVFTDLARRVGSPDLDIAITAILIQRNVGGNLSEILFNVTRTIRERAKLHGEIRVLTSRQRLTGNMVAALPVLVAGAFMALNPEIGERLFVTTAGQIALAVGIAFELLGLFLIRRLAVVEV